jgi:hypothetical protein
VQDSRAKLLAGGGALFLNWMQGFPKAVSLFGVESSWLVTFRVWMSFLPLYNRGSELNDTD